MKNELPALGYSYDALEPHIDEQTMKIHHTKHHAKYVDKFNSAIEGTPLQEQTFREIFKNMSEHPAAVAHNGGQAYNHTMFWKIISPKKNTTPKGRIADLITRSFGSYDAFKEEFTKVATTQFGSGWAWLVQQDNDKLVVCSTPNHVNPLMDTAEVKGEPIVCLDVWEHAYYLKYQNKRPEFIEAFWHIVDWEEAEKFLQ